MALEAPLKQDSDIKEFPSKTFQSKLRESDLEKIQFKYQVPPEFELKVPFEIDRPCNPPPGQIALYEVFPGWVEAAFISFSC